MSQFLKVKPSPTLTPYYSYRASGNMLYESFKDPLEARRQATHAPAWEIWENKVQKLFIWASCSVIFGKFSGGLKVDILSSLWCFLMPGRSLDHPRMILDRFGEHHFLTKIFPRRRPTWVNPETYDSQSNGNQFSIWLMHFEAEVS